MNGNGILGAHTVRKIWGYLPQFLAFSLSKFPLARGVVLLIVVSLVLEYAALSLMLPLVGRGGSSAIGQTVIVFWGRMATVLGFPATQQTWLWMFLVLLALRVAAGYAQMVSNIYVAKQIHAFLSDKVFKRVVVDEPLARIYQRTVGHYVSLAGDETAKAGNIFFYVGQLLTAGLSALAGLVVLCAFSPQAFGLTLVFILVCALLLFRGMRRILSLSSTSRDLSRALNTNFIEALNGLRSVRSLSAETFVVATYREQIRRYVRDLFQIDALNQGYRSVPALLLLAMGVIWLWPSSSTGPAGSTLFFFAITTMLIRILTSLGEFVAASGKLVADIRASHDAGELLHESAPEASSTSGAVITTPISRIDLRDVECGYDPGRPVLRGISGQFRSGRSYAVVGKSGAGKSTLADILLGILPVTSGQVHVNDVPLAGIDPRSLRSKIILVEQQTRIFTGTIRENVAMGCAFSDAEVLAALALAGLGEFVGELPSGLATVLDYQGANLSGGQRQRIGIARALVRGPDVVILDEGTSAVDSAMKRALVATLRAHFDDRILLFITHDAEVLAAVDEVWRIVDGKLERDPFQRCG